MAVAAAVVLTAQTGMAANWGLAQLAGQVVGEAIRGADPAQAEKMERKYGDTRYPITDLKPSSSGEAAVIGVFQGILGR